MKKYDAYKDSGIEWIGEIPRHWEVNKGKRFIMLTNGYPFDSSKFSPYSNSGLPLVRIRDIDTNKPETFYNGEIVHEALVDDGDILIGMDGDFNIAVWKGGKALLNQRVCRLDRNNLYDERFLFYLFPKYLKIINDLTYFTTVKHLSNNDLWQSKYALPPKQEQTAIANYLDHKTAEIDELIADKKRLLKLYEEEKTAIINQAVTKGLDPDVPMKDSGIEWLGEIPEHWEVKRLKYIAEIVLGKMLTNEDKGGYYQKPYLRAANLNWLKVNVHEVKEMWFSERELKKYRLKRNDLLVSEGGEVGRTCIWKNELPECYIQNSVHKVTMNDDCSPHYFLQVFYLFGQKGAFDLIVNRISIAHLTVEKLKDIEFIVPPLEEQQSIVDYIETELSRIDLQISRTKNLIDLLTEYRTALISEVVTGKVKVV
jgi:type I restriction enzyme S subunit